MNDERYGIRNGASGRKKCQVRCAPVLGSKSEQSLQNNCSWTQAKPYLYSHHLDDEGSRVPMECGKGTNVSCCVELHRYDKQHTATITSLEATLELNILSSAKSPSNTHIDPKTTNKKLVESKITSKLRQYYLVKLIRGQMNKNTSYEIAHRPHRQLGGL